MVNMEDNESPWAYIAIGATVLALWACTVPEPEVAPPIKVLVPVIKKQVIVKHVHVPGNCESPDHPHFAFDDVKPGYPFDAATEVLKSDREQHIKYEVDLLEALHKCSQ